MILMMIRKRMIMSVSIDIRNDSKDDNNASTCFTSQQHDVRGERAGPVHPL